MTKTYDIFRDTLNGGTHIVQNSFLFNYTMVPTGRLTKEFF